MGIHHGAAIKLQALRRGSVTRASNQRWAKLRSAVKTKLLMIMEVGTCATFMCFLDRGLHAVHASNEQVKHSDGEIDRIHIHEGDDPVGLAEVSESLDEE